MKLHRLYCFICSVVERSVITVDLSSSSFDAYCFCLRNYDLNVDRILIDPSFLGRDDSLRSLLCDYYRRLISSFLFVQSTSFIPPHFYLFVLFLTVLGANFYSSPYLLFDFICPSLGFDLSTSHFLAHSFPTQNLII